MGYVSQEKETYPIGFNNDLLEFLGLVIEESIILALCLELTILSISCRQPILTPPSCMVGPTASGLCFSINSVRAMMSFSSLRYHESAFLPKRSFLRSLSRLFGFIVISQPYPLGSLVMSSGSFSRR